MPPRNCFRSLVPRPEYARVAVGPGQEKPIVSGVRGVCPRYYDRSERGAALAKARAAAKAGGVGTAEDVRDREAQRAARDFIEIMFCLNDSAEKTTDRRLQVRLAAFLSCVGEGQIDGIGRGHVSRTRSRVFGSRANRSFHCWSLSCRRCGRTLI